VPRLTEQEELAARFAAAPVARLATLRPDGSPRLVPITFVLVDGLVCSAIDAVKPKRTARLARLDDVRRDPRVGLIVDRYDDDWSHLWWVRLDGHASVREPHSGGLSTTAGEALRAKYPAYRDVELAGPLLVVRPLRWTGWTARYRPGNATNRSS